MQKKSRSVFVVSLIVTSLILPQARAQKCLTQKEQSDLAKYIAKCEQNAIDAQFYRERLEVEYNAKPGVQMNPMIALGLGILVGGTLVYGISRMR